MATHDPQRIVLLLRDHLAAHDKRLLFLFGAGTSSSVNISPPAKPGERRRYEPLIPALVTLTKKCKEAVDGLSEKHKKAWNNIVEECEALELDPHIENVLGRLRLKVDAAGPEDIVLDLDSGGLEQFESAIRTTIATLAAPSEESIPLSLPHEDFAQWVRHARRRHPVEVFTTNYDVLIERALERARVPLFDGFVGSYEPYFIPDAIENDESLPGYEWARLWKLHGSINWVLRGGSVIRSSFSPGGEMILPSHRKYDESRKLPYLALMDRLGRCLSGQGSLIITCGYSWNDEHINAAILTAIDNHPSSHAIALLYPPLASLPHLVSLAERRDNLIVAASREGLIRRVRGEWALPEQIDRATASFLDVAFDSDGLPEQKAGRVTGELRLGDFNALCQLLAAMNTSEEERAYGA